MNRIILIGNGFDLAHGLPTSYGNFINWYWSKWEIRLRNSEKQQEEDVLCSFRLASDDKSFKDYIERFEPKLKDKSCSKFIESLLSISTCIKESSLFIDHICKAVKTKGWVDIENEYYKLLKYRIEKGRLDGHKIKVDKLNLQLEFLKNKLIEYLNSIKIEDSLHKDHIAKIIYSPIKYRDIAVSANDKLIEHIQNELTRRDEDFLMKMGVYNYKYNYYQLLNGLRKEQDSKVELIQTKILSNEYPNEFFLPNEIMFLNFNYTNTAKLYLPTTKPGFEINHIHGELSNPESVIFGYGDELDENYKKLSNLNDNEYLKNFKSIKYLESDRYRKALQFMDAEPYQVFIMGHSCGNSDRTLLNTLFEHKNCVSIKPYYYQFQKGDDYLKIVQNISRNFTDMKLMRDRVVNKTYCEPFSIQEPETND